MNRSLIAAVLGLTFLSTQARAQGPLQRAGQALDQAGRNIRRGVENAITRGEITAQERELLGRVQGRLVWDKGLLGSALRLTVRPDGVVILQGSVVNEAAKAQAVSLAQGTVGVTAVVDELAVVKDVKVIPATPAEVLIPEPIETRVVVPPARVVEPEVKVIVPEGTTVIEKR